MDIKTSTEMAELYGLKSSISFNKLLAKCGLLIQTENGFVLNESLRGHGYVCVIDKAYFLPNGIRATKKKSAWTESGQQFIRQHLGRIGILPTNEQSDLFTA